MKKDGNAWERFSLLLKSIKFVGTSLGTRRERGRKVWERVLCSHYSQYI